MKLDGDLQDPDWQGKIKYRTAAQPRLSSNVAGLYVWVNQRETW